MHVSESSLIPYKLTNLENIQKQCIIKQSTSIILDALSLEPTKHKTIAPDDARRAARQASRESELRIAAATKIQAVVRGNQVRKKAAATAKAKAEEAAAERLSRQTTVPPIQPEHVPSSMWDSLKRPRKEAGSDIAKSRLEDVAQRAVKRLSGQTIGPKYDAIQQSPTNSESTRPSTPLSNTEQTQVPTKTNRFNHMVKVFCEPEI